MNRRVNGNKNTLDGWFSVRMSSAEIAKVDDLAEGLEVNRGRIVRMALREYLERYRTKAEAAKVRHTLAFVN